MTDKQVSRDNINGHKHIYVHVFTEYFWYLNESNAG